MSLWPRPAGHTTTGHWPTGSGPKEASGHYAEKRPSLTEVFQSTTAQQATSSYPYYGHFGEALITNYWSGLLVICAEKMLLEGR